MTIKGLALWPRVSSSLMKLFAQQECKTPFERPMEALAHPPKTLGNTDRQMKAMWCSIMCARYAMPMFAAGNPPTIPA